VLQVVYYKIEYTSVYGVLRSRGGEKKMANAFEVLGIAPESGEAEIRKAHRELARRWHPDRFLDGPERMWAEEKMMTINNAFHEALQKSSKSASSAQEVTPEIEQLADAKRLMELGQLSAARQALLRVATRSAEWNYLFGAVLLRLGEYEKAVLYFGIASRQRPQNTQYRTAYHSAEAIRNQRKFKPILDRLMHPFLGKKG